MASKRIKSGVVPPSEAYNKLSESDKEVFDEKEETIKRLEDHRKNISLKGEEAYYNDKEKLRLARNVVKYFILSGYPYFTRRLKEGKELTLKFVEIIFTLQCKRPFFHVENSQGKVMCWNRPSLWDKDYIMYEWGHLKSINQNGDDAHKLENLCLQSARCNQHIQTSLDVEELKIYGGKLEAIIEDHLKRRDYFFSNDPSWKEFLDQLAEFHEVCRITSDIKK